MLPAGLLLQNRYRIAALLGQGAMGAVYEAFDTRLEARVALKQLTAGAAFDQAFAREAQLLARLRHPAIPLVSDYFAEQGSQFLVMQLVAGPDLATRLARRSTPFSPAEVLPWADQLLAALEYLHGREPPIIHRDIKPQNIKLGAEGEVVLLDFGLARGGDTPAAATLAGYTPHYAPPEQIATNTTSPQSDLYALAATLYHLLSGNYPPSAIERATALAHGQPDPLLPLDNINPVVPVPVAAVLFQALRPDASERPPSASAMRQLLHQASDTQATHVLAGQPAPAQPTPPTLVPHNLPQPTAPLLGRASDLAHLHTLLLHDEVRLLTLLGPGGIGKTRLALELARQLVSTAAMPAGVFFVSLAAVRSADLVLDAIAQVLSVRETASQGMLARLVAHIGARRLLLVLDNFEQVVNAAPLLAELLAACPALKLLVTSREVLRLSAERSYPLAPLALPADDLPQSSALASVAQAAAVQLFVERAQAVRRDFQLNQQNAAVVVAICRRLDGLPLALELAAARTRLLPLQALYDRLTQASQSSPLRLLTGGARDLPSRQQTLRNTIAWSYELLNSVEQQLFRRLAVFLGGRSLEAAEVVTSDQADLPLEAVLDYLQSLLDKSLLYPDDNASEETRYLMLETIWEYGNEQLQASGEGPHLRQRHADYFVALAEQALAELRGPAQASWLNRLEREHANLRAALSWCLASGAYADGARMANALQRFWEVRGHLSEGRRWFDALLAQQASLAPPLLIKLLNASARHAYSQSNYALTITQSEIALELARSQHDESAAAVALNNLGGAYRQQGDPARALAYHEAAIASWRASNDQRGLSVGLLNAGISYKDQGNYPRAGELIEASLKLYRQLGDTRSEALALDHLSALARQIGSFTQAHQLQEQCLALRRALGDKRGIAASYADMGNIEADQGNVARAAELYTLGLAGFRAVGERWGEAVVLDNLGFVARHQGDYQGAQAYHQQALALRRAVGDKRGSADTLDNLGIVLLRLGQVDAAAASFAECLVLRRNVQHPGGIASAIEGLADVAIARTHSLAAARLYGAAAGLRATTGENIVPAALSEYQATLERLHQALGPAAFAAAFAAGQALTLDAACAEALQEAP